MINLKELMIYSNLNSIYITNGDYLLNKKTFINLINPINYKFVE